MIAPLPMLERVKYASFGKNCMDSDDLLEAIKNPRVRMNVRLGRLSGFVRMPFDIVMEVSSSFYLRTSEVIIKMLGCSLLGSAGPSSSCSHQRAAPTSLSFETVNFNLEDGSRVSEYA